MMERINLAEKLAAFDEPYSPWIVADVNDYKVVVVKAKGEFVWHTHPDTDELFLVLRGSLTILARGSDDVDLQEGELCVVPRGVEHCPRADEEAHVLLFEPTGTPNTGDSGGSRTAQERHL